MQPLSQTAGIPLVDGATYRYELDLRTSGKFGFDFTVSSVLVVSNAINTSGLHIFSGTFVADTLGEETSQVTLTPTVGTDSGVVYRVSIRRVISAGTDDAIPVKEFLTGNLDDGKPIFFRADTQTMQLMPNFETFGSPLAIVTKLQRGSLVKCFVSLDNDDFYELEGNATKGVSIVKVNSRNRSTIPTPPIARKIKVSWRDSSAQLCRLTQGAVVFLPSTMDYSE